MNENPEIDGIIIGEGEKILLNYLTKNIEEVKGIYFKKDGEIKFNGEIMNENPEIDGIIIGEGEKILLNYLTKNIEEVKGIYFKKDGEIKFNGYESLIEEKNSS